MKKPLFFLAAALCLLLAMPVYAAEDAEETVEATVRETEEQSRSAATEGTCGEGIRWKLEGGTLTVTGSGAMDSGCPWEEHKDSIEKVVLAGGVTVVGADAFADCDALTTVDFGDALREIGPRAFYDCDGLTDIRLPQTFKRFGERSFMECTNLTEVYCAGGMPSFRGNCLWNGNDIAIYTPSNNPWPQEEVQVLTANFGGRLQIHAGGAPVTYTEPTKPPTVTEPETVIVTEPATEPETEPVTEPSTEPTEAAETTEMTAAPQTTAAAETEAAATEAAEEATLVEKAGSSGWLWMVLVAAGLTGVLVLALVIRMITHKDGKYSE